MTINFYLDSKKSTLGSKTLYCFVRGLYKGKTIYLNTNLKIEPKHWNEKTQQIRRTHPSYSELNSFLENFKFEIQKQYSNLSLNGISFEDMKVHLQKILTNKEDKDDKKSLFKVLDLFIELRKSELTLSTIKKYKVLKNHLLNFQQMKKYKIDFDSITLDFYDRFVAFLYNELNHTNNTAHKIFGNFKSFMNWCVEREYTSNLLFRKFRTREIESEVIYLSKQELLTIYNLDLTKSPRLDKVRDIFCFACFTGQRFSDVIDFNTDDVIEGIWRLRTHKTKDVNEIFLNDYALEVFNKYKNSGINFPRISNQKCNEYLKEICKIAEISDEVTIVRYRGSERIEITKPKHDFITTHTARRTFVTLSLEQNMRPEVLMKITGHKDYKTMKKYLKITDKVKHSEMQNVWRKM